MPNGIPAIRHPGPYHANGSRSSNLTRRRWHWLGSACATCLGLTLLGACSGGGGSAGSGGDASNAVVNDASNPTVDPVVSTTSTEDLKVSASSNISNGIGINLDSIQSLDDSGFGAVDTLASSNVTGDTSMNTIDVTGNPISESALGPDANRMLDKTLGLFAGDNSITTREGDRIIVDPDEFSLCTDSSVAEGGDLADLQRCQQLLSDLTVYIDPVTDDSGTVTYLFRDTPVLTIGYSPTTDSFELHLAGLKSFSDANDALDPDSQGETSAPATMQGSLQVSSRVDNATAGAEAGSLSLDITQTISIADVRNNIDISLGTGTLFSVFADAATGAGGMEFSAGAARLQGSIAEDLVSLNLDGFTGRADITNNGGQLVVSNLGIGRGPLVMNINNAEILRATMETFGFEVNDVDNELVINGNLDLNVLFDSTAISDNSFDALSLMLNVAAPAGTGSSLAMTALCKLHAVAHSVLATTPRRAMTRFPRRSPWQRDNALIRKWKIRMSRKTPASRLPFASKD